MPFTTLGQAATHTTAVSASPTPTASSFAVDQLGPLREQDLIWITVSGVAHQRSITAIVGSVLTLSTALPGAPSATAPVISYSEAISNDRLNRLGVFTTTSGADLEASSTSGMPDQTRASVPGSGIYRLKQGDTTPADGDLVRTGLNGGRWFRETDAGGLASAYLAGDIQDSLPMVSATLDWPSLVNGGSTTSTGITVPGARTDDLVIVQGPSTLPAGFQVRGSVTAKNTVTLQAFNGTGSTQDLASATYRVWVVTPNRMPPITRIATEQFEALLNGSYNATTLQALLSDPKQAAHFLILLASRWRMQALFNYAPAKTAIQGSALANALAEAIDGAGY